jgi:hypothetical protein
MLFKKIDDDQENGGTNMQKISCFFKEIIKALLLAGNFVFLVLVLLVFFFWCGVSKKLFLVQNLDKKKSYVCARLTLVASQKVETLFLINIVSTLLTRL